MAGRQASRHSRIDEMRKDLSAIMTFAHDLAADLGLAERNAGMLSMRGEAVVLTLSDEHSFGRASNLRGTDLTEEIAGVRCLLDELEEDLRALASDPGR